jgi:DNA polymerase elongation subunit (family B)
LVELKLGYSQMQLIAKGIEIRRHDAPNFIKEFQSESPHTMFNCTDLAEVYSKDYDNALLLVTRTIDKVMTGEIEVQDLVIYKLLRQDLIKYSSLFPHVSAAFRLREAGKSLVHGENIQYVYTDAQHKNPLCRVTPLELIKQGKEQEQKDSLVVLVGRSHFKTDSIEYIYTDAHHQIHTCFLTRSNT